MFINHQYHVLSLLPLLLLLMMMLMLGKSIAGAMHRTESNVLYRGRSHHRGGKLLKYSSKSNKEVIFDKFPVVAIYNRLKLFFWSRPRMLSFSKFPALLEAEDHASTFVQTRCTWQNWGILHMSTWAGSKFDPPKSPCPFPHPNWHSSPKLDPKIHGI